MHDEGSNNNNNNNNSSSSSKDNSPSNSDDALASMEEGEGEPRGQPPPTMRTQAAAFMLIALCLFMQTLSATVARVLWPLYLKDMFKWTSVE